MPFEVVRGSVEGSSGMGVLGGMVIVEGKGQFWGEFGASYCNDVLSKLLWEDLLLLSPLCCRMNKV